MTHFFLFQGIDSQLITWGTSIRKILNIVTAIFAIVGGFLVFFQYMQGNDQAQKNFIKFIIGLGIVGLVNVIVTFFLPNADTF
jgi:orotate phosphoribosyltransferase